MTLLCTLLLALPTAILLVAVSVIVVQIGASLWPPRSTGVNPGAPRVAVVVPAHDESGAIQRTIETVRAQLPPNGRLLVVADNCTDNTAHIAAASGAEVTVRQDARRVGKGYALDHAVRTLRPDPPDVVIFIDADCQVGPGSVAAIANLCLATGRPVQAENYMLSMSSGSLLDRVARFAWTVKTHVRPSGAANLGWPCQLMGTGMALPWELVRSANLATGHLAEDQKLGADLALQGNAPIFCRAARVTSYFPLAKDGRRTQRTRWEHGHLAIIQEYLPRLVFAAVRTRNPQLLAFALDLCIPPLSLLVLALTLTGLLSLLLFATTESRWPLLAASVSITLLGGSLLLAWWRYGRDIISLRDLCAAPIYCVARVPSLARFFINRQVDWIRTDRL